MRNLLKGFRLAFAVTLGLPFLIVLLPLWVIYVLNERRNGRQRSFLPGSSPASRTSRRSGEAATPDSRRGNDKGEGAGPGHPSPPGTGTSIDRIDAGGLRTAVATGRVALVTGGGRRLGKEISLELARLGFRVGVAYHRRQESAAKVVEEIRLAGGEARALALDLTNPARLESFLSEAERQLDGVPTLLVNNAALFHPTPLENPSWETLGELLQVNLQGPLWLSLQAAQRMSRHDGGQIINICDLWGERPLKGHAAYSAAKAGLIMATRALARDLGPAIRVNGIAPGAVLPPEEGSGPEMEAYRSLLARTPLAAEATPEAVVQAVRYLLTARFVTGEILHVDGGRRWV
ncbi:MAG: SDR family NAD(P)-dependent oxidoreductase [Magnetococcales bacterium]|nr:SDR family NAD(P)-dependent oxidoreductase [Magnetococcales bacterium]